MDKSFLIQNYLKEYKFNKARIGFLGNQVRRYSLEEDEHYAITGFTNSPDFQEALDILIPGHGIGLKQVGMVKEDIPIYGFKRVDVLEEFEQELSRLKYITGIVEDALYMLEGVGSKYRVVIEEYYISGTRIEDIADILHIGRSQCYELLKEAFQWVLRVVSGEKDCETASLDGEGKNGSVVSGKKGKRTQTR